MRNESRTRMNDDEWDKEDGRVGYKLKHTRRDKINKHRVKMERETEPWYTLGTGKEEK
jgi:hypothetical protein